MQTRNFITICGAWFAIFFAGNATLFAAETVVESGERKISLASRFLGKLHPVSLQDQWEFIDISGTPMGNGTTPTFRLAGPISVTISHPGRVGGIEFPGTTRRKNWRFPRDMIY